MCISWIAFKQSDIVVGDQSNTCFLYVVVVCISYVHNVTDFNRLHLRVHHDDKRYECDECGKTFIRHDHLTKHQKTHSGTKDAR